MMEREQIAIVYRALGIIDGLMSSMDVPEHVADVISEQVQVLTEILDAFV